jgi:hypothetical protein
MMQFRGSRGPNGCTVTQKHIDGDAWLLTPFHCDVYEYTNEGFAWGVIVSQGRSDQKVEEAKMLQLAVAMLFECAACYLGKTPTQAAKIAVDYHGQFADDVLCKLSHDDWIIDASVIERFLQGVEMEVGG